MLRNLKGIDFPERFDITQSTIKLLNQAGDSPYALSMPLLISALLGNKAIYTQNLYKIEKALEAVSANKADNAFNAWIYARVLFAAHLMDDRQTAKRQFSTLNSLWNDPETATDRFFIWAAAYVVSVDVNHYNATKDDLRIGSKHLTAECKKIMMDIDASTSRQQEACSDALWIWIMNVFAAANNNDVDFYRYSIKRICDLMAEPTISFALTKGLVRTAASNDYPAWALALIRIAAAFMGDEETFNELETPIQTAIAESKECGAIAEALLAQVNNQLAVEKTHPFPDSNQHTMSCR